MAGVLRAARPEICRVLSRELHTVVSTVTTTDDEGWSHHLFGCGTELDKHHSYPAGLAWDDGDVRALAASGAATTSSSRGSPASTPAPYAGTSARPRRRPATTRAATATATSGCGGRSASGAPDESYAALAGRPAWSAVTAG